MAINIPGGRKVKKKVLTKIAQQKLKLRKQLWPECCDDMLWDRQVSDGWLSVPRAMPLILKIMDMLAPKGKPVSHVYFDLWCRTYDDSFVVVSKSREMAYYSGFSGERAESTWASRVRSLNDLGFVDIKGGVNPINYVLIFNPYHVIKQHYKSGALNTAAYNALQERLIGIGGSDLDDED